MKAWLLSSEMLERVKFLVATSEELPSEGIAPDFVEPIRAVEVAEGETAVLECKVVGEPAPEIKWFKGGEEIKPNDHFKIEAKPDGTQRLTVKNAKTSDIDEYRCEVCVRTSWSMRKMM